MCGVFVSENETVFFVPGSDDCTEKPDDYPAPLFKEKGRIYIIIDKCWLHDSQKDSMRNRNKNETKTVQTDEGLL